MLRLCATAKRLSELERVITCTTVAIRINRQKSRIQTEAKRPEQRPAPGEA